jgi:hypothetical protein
MTDSSPESGLWFSSESGRHDSGLLFMAPGLERRTHAAQCRAVLERVCSTNDTPPILNRRLRTRGEDVEMETHDDACSLLMPVSVGAAKVIGDGGKL